MCFISILINQNDLTVLALANYNNAILNFIIKEVLD